MSQRPENQAKKSSRQGDDVDWEQLHAALSEPFPASELRYRAGAINRDKTKAQALPYVDPRAYEDRLNALVPGHWQVEFQPWGDNRIICRLTIHDVTRSSTGESSDSPEGVAGTSAEAQAFKRACAKFGLGRYLYALEPRWVDYDPTTRRIEEPAPQARPRGSPGAGPAKPPETDARPHSPTIGKERATAMQRELSRVGIQRGQHAGYAARILGRPIADLAELTEDEARTIWAKARGTEADSAA